MIRFSAQARKYLIALGGVGLLVACNRLGLEIPGLPDLIRDCLIAIITAEGVYRVRNKTEA